MSDRLLGQDLLNALQDRLGWQSLRPVQELAIPPILAGENVLILAPTAGGKTEAAVLPVLEQLHLNRPSGVACLYLSPLRALLNNQESRFESLASLIDQTCFKWHGDVPASRRRHFLRHPGAFLLTTPESLEVMFLSESVDTRSLFRELRVVIVDEIHAFAGSERGCQVVSLLERLKDLLKYDFQRIALSATVGDPDDLATWVCGTSARLRRVIRAPAQPTPKRFDLLDFRSSPPVVPALAPYFRGRKAIFFVDSRAGTEELAHEFEEAGFAVDVHHSSVSRQLREEAEERLFDAQTGLLISTSTMELGIDVGGLDLVAQSNPPFSVSSFSQRLGRTGRRPGSTAWMVLTYDSEWSLLQHAAIISLARQGIVESSAPTKRAYTVLVQQLLAQVVGELGVSLETLWQRTSASPAFMEIPRSEFDALVAYLLRERLLAWDSGRLTLGELGEKEFERRHFEKLYSVFDAPVELTVIDEQHNEIGTLEARFVASILEKESVFVLAGRRWAVVDADLQSGYVLVRPTPHGRAPRWRSSPGLLSGLVCQEMRRLLAHDVDVSFLGEHADSLARGLRKIWRPLLAEGKLPVVDRGLTIDCLCFAGGRVSLTLAVALKQQLGCEATSDDIGAYIERRADQPPPEDVAAAINDLRARFPEPSSLAPLLPKWRLSKFQAYLPPEIDARYRAERLLDIDATNRILLNFEPKVMNP